MACDESSDLFIKFRHNPGFKKSDDSSGAGFDILGHLSYDFSLYILTNFEESRYCISVEEIESVFSPVCSNMTDSSIALVKGLCIFFCTKTEKEETIDKSKKVERKKVHTGMKGWKGLNTDVEPALRAVDSAKQATGKKV